MRVPVIIGALALTVGSAWGQNPTPFVNGLPPTVESTMLGRTDSLPGNALDRLGVWKESDVELPDESKSLAGGAGPTVKNLAIETADGTMVVSQLWDASCTTSECPTRVYLIKRDGSREDKLAPTMLPQIIPAGGDAATRGVSGKPSIFLNPDGKSITVISADHGQRVYPLQ